mmetsp:Transcript_36255/g.111179  ORF Transcript_36255/g.111179 Transcript_36255/m.111179 type:complete len:474 (+) Transcript_36255:725-2146(+)
MCGSAAERRESAASLALCSATSSSKSVKACVRYSYAPSSSPQLSATCAHCTYRRSARLGAAAVTAWTIWPTKASSLPHDTSSVAPSSSASRTRRASCRKRKRSGTSTWGSRPGAAAAACLYAALSTRASASVSSCASACIMAATGAISPASSASKPSASERSEAPFAVSAPLAGAAGDESPWSSGAHSTSSRSARSGSEMTQPRPATSRSRRDTTRRCSSGSSRDTSLGHSVSSSTYSTSPPLRFSGSESKSCTTATARFSVTTPSDSSRVLARESARSRYSVCASYASSASRARARARASDGSSRSEAQRRSTWSATGVKTSRASVSPSAGSSAQRRLIRCERIADSSAAAESQERKRRRVGSVAVWYATGKTWQTHSRRYSCASPSLHDTISSSSGCTTSAVYTCSVTPSSEARRCKLPPTTTLSSARSFSRCSLFAAGPWCCIRTQSFAISPKLARTILIASETVPPSPS